MASQTTTEHENILRDAYYKAVEGLQALADWNSLPHLPDLPANP